MRIDRLAAFLGLFFAGSFIITGFPALAATPSFTVTATSAALSSSSKSGEGSSTITLTSVNGYSGSIIVNCIPPTPPAGVKVPFCSPGMPSATTPAISAAVPAIVEAFTLTAGQAVNGTVTFYNFPYPVSASLPRPANHKLAQSLALAGVLLVGFGFRRKSWHFLSLTLLALGMLAVMSGISACGGSNSLVTPGTYAYTISATDINTAASVNTSVNVTVP
jgi:hypothetical protein